MVGLIILIMLLFVPACLADSPQQEWVYNASSYITTSPIYDNGYVYFGSLDGKLYSIQVVYGKPIFSKSYGTSIQSMPALDGNTLYFGTSDGYFHAVDTVRGSEKWKFKAGGNVDSMDAAAPWGPS
jgi:outer membrane protein assembly factor BamB